MPGYQISIDGAAPVTVDDYAPTRNPNYGSGWGLTAGVDDTFVGEYGAGVAGGKRTP